MPYLLAAVRSAHVDWACAAPVDPPQLSALQTRIVLYIEDYQRTWGASPLYREIGLACGLAADSSVHYQIGRLVALGVIRKPCRLVRAMHLTVAIARRSQP